MPRRPHSRPLRPTDIWARTYAADMAAFNLYRGHIERGAVYNVLTYRGQRRKTFVSNPGHRAPDLDPMLALDLAVDEYARRYPERVAKFRIHPQRGGTKDEYTKSWRRSNRS